MDYRIHEDGFSLLWAEPETATTWCDAAVAVNDIVARDHPDIVVVSFASEGSCGTDPVATRRAVHDAARGAKLIVVVNPAADPAVPPLGEATIVDPQRLIGPEGTLDEGCLWFDTCLPNGRVAFRWRAREHVRWWAMPRKCGL
jgi:hypothetical protein